MSYKVVELSKVQNQKNNCWIPRQLGVFGNPVNSVAESVIVYDDNDL